MMFLSLHAAAQGGLGWLPSTQPWCWGRSAPLADGLPFWKFCLCCYLSQLSAWAATAKNNLLRNSFFPTLLDCSQSVSGSLYWLPALTWDVLQKALSEIHSGDLSVFFYGPYDICDTARWRFNFQRVSVWALVEVEFPFCKKFCFSAQYKAKKSQVLRFFNLCRWKHFCILLLFWKVSQIIKIERNFRTKIYFDTQQPETKPLF